MMGPRQQMTPKLFYTGFSLEDRVPADHLLRRIATTVDFAFVRAAVAERYGYNGQVSLDPIVLLKLMLLLFLENVRSERELVRQLAYRLDWLWFCGLDLDAVVPDHSVLSKARRRWGAAVLEELFGQVLDRCVAAGLVDGRTLHVDASCVAASADRQALQPRLSVAARALYERLETAEAATNEGHLLGAVLAAHEANTGAIPETVVADQQYGTAENYGQLRAAGITPCLPHGQRGAQHGKFGHAAFRYEAAQDCFVCPAGQVLRPYHRHEAERRVRYRTAAGVCAACPQRGSCTDSRHGRRVERHLDQEQIDWADQCLTRGARRHLMRRRKIRAEGSFADAANLHGFKRARWRGLWRMRIQNVLIATLQNLRKLLRPQRPRPTAVACSATARAGDAVLRAVCAASGVWGLTTPQRSGLAADL